MKRVAQLAVFISLFSAATLEMRLFAGPSTEPQHTGQSESTAQQTKLTVKDVVFRSASLAREMHYLIYLPPQYNESATKRFPVLYLLHGFYGNYTDWDKQSHLREYARDSNLIVVMPDGGNHWYVNSPEVPGDRFEDYIARDLIAETDGRYRTVASRESRAIAGLSMGGYGALNIGLKHPELFAFIGSFSGALNAPSDLGPRQPQFQETLLEAFGPAGSATRKENDVFERAKEIQDVSRLPYIYLACGKADVFLELNQQLSAELHNRHFAFEFHEGFGNHDWKYWNQAIKEMLPVLMGKLKPAN